MAAREVQGGANRSLNGTSRFSGRRPSGRRRLILIGCPGLESFARTREATHWSPREIHRVRPFRDEGGILMLGDAAIEELDPAPLLRLVPVPPWRILLCPVAHRPEVLWKWAPAFRWMKPTSRALLGPRVDECALEPDRLPLAEEDWGRLFRCRCRTCRERLHVLDLLDRVDVGAWAARLPCSLRKLRDWARSHQGAHPRDLAWLYVEAVAALEEAEGWRPESVAASLGYSSAESFRRARTKRGRRGKPRTGRGGGSEL